jgi:hypothetical protein
MREREPAMKALSKRVNARTGKSDAGVGAVATAASTAASTATGERGPRNQPKRKKANKRK